MEGRRKGERGKGRGEREEREEEGGPRNKVVHDVHGIIFPIPDMLYLHLIDTRTMHQKQLYMADIHDLPRPVSLPRHLQGRNRITGARMVLFVFKCSIYISQQAF